MVEIMIAMGIMVLLATLTVSIFGEFQAEALEKAAQSELDAIRSDIHRYQMERRTDYTLKTAPLGANSQDRRDPWQMPYRVDPALRIVYSVGPDGKDDRGDGDDIRLPFDGYQFSELHAPTGFRAAEHGVDWVDLSWAPVRYQGGVSGYNVFRRESVASTEFTTVPQNPALLPDSPEPRFRDAGLSPGLVYYYALEVVAKDGTRITAPAPLGFQIPLTAPPRLVVSPTQQVLAVDQTGSFTLQATGYGASLRTITFDGQAFDVSGGSKTLVMTRKFSQPGTQRLVAEAFDVDGRKAQVEAVVEVR